MSPYCLDLNNSSFYVDWTNLVRELAGSKMSQKLSHFQAQLLSAIAREAPEHKGSFRLAWAQNWVLSQTVTKLTVDANGEKGDTSPLQGMKENEIKMGFGTVSPHT